MSRFVLVLVCMAISWMCSNGNNWNQTIDGDEFDNLIDRKDFHGPDSRVLHSLKHSMRTNYLSGKCVQVNNTGILPLTALNVSYVWELMKMKLPSQVAVVSPTRRRVAAWLSKAALTVPEGDFVETGVYFGTTASIIMNVLMHFDTCGRKLYAFDSFEGLPPPQKEDNGQGKTGRYKASYDTFVNNLKAVGSFDDRLIIAKGWFKDTCPISPVKKIAFLRLDGDLFASTMDAITALYDRVVPGGYIYVDDYGTFEGCRVAIDKFRYERRIYEPLNFVQENASKRYLNAEAVWWVKR